jgi:hypothetical protein
MSLNYKLVTTSEKVSVVETQTDFTIKDYEKRDPARALMRHLNLGGGFAGWTPTFFTRDVMKVIKNLEKD